jgi:hypothetical protein
MAGTIVADQLEAASTSTLVIKNGVANTPPTIQDSAGTQIGTFCRAWVNFNGTTNTGGFCTIRASFNVTSVADNGTGDYTVNFTTAFADANYASVFGGTFNTSATRDNNIGVRNNVAPTTTALRINVFEPNTGLIDALYCNVGIFR